MTRGSPVIGQRSTVPFEIPKLICCPVTIPMVLDVHHYACMIYIITGIRYVLLTQQILHELVYQNPRNHSIVKYNLVQ